MSNLSRVTVNLSHLAAALPLAGTADIRYYLNGVCIAALGDQLRTVATDGNVLGCLRTTRPTDDIGDGELIIPTDVVKALIKACPKSLTTAVLTRLPKREGDGPDVARWAQEDWNVVFTAVTGKFPDWSRVVPAEVNGEIAQFNPDLMARFAKTAKALGSKCGHVFIHHNGTGASGVSVPGKPEFMGVAMPIKFKPEDVLGLWSAASSFRLAA